MRKGIVILECTLWLIGFIIITFSYDWKLSLGIFILIWANNIGIYRIKK